MWGHPGLFSSEEADGSVTKVVFILLIVAAALLAAVPVSLVFTRRRARVILDEARDLANQAVEEAKREAEALGKRALLDAREKLAADRARRDEDLARQRAKIQQEELRLEHQAHELEQKAADAETLRAEIDRREAQIVEQEQATARKAASVEEKIATLDRKLEQIAGLTQAEARAELTRLIEEDVRRQMTGFVKRSREEAEETVDRQSKRIIAQAIYRAAARPAVQSTMTTMTLPNDEVKGRIIGREGRNIRALESATGVDIIIDDTPHTLLLSAYDPARRELAKIAIERLIEDGRVHPARVEEVTAKVREEMDELTLKAGEAATLELGLAEVHPRLQRLLGRLRFRLAHGQNLLQHSLETAYLAGYMTAELGGQADVAKRAGLLHEVAQAEEEPPSMPIVLESGDLVQKFGESAEVVHAIKALDRSVEPRTIEAMLVSAANRISESRPGARKDNLDVFVERLKSMEDIALSFPGVRKAFAVRSGKELRVIVEATEVNDEGVVFLSHDIATRLEKEVDYPGQVRVSVIREVRAIDFAV